MFFAFGTSAMQLFVSRLILSSVGAGFVVGIHMTALWFKPRDIGFAEGFYAGWGNFGSAAAAMTIPTVALVVFGGDDGWRYAIATSGHHHGPFTACSTGSPSPMARPPTPTANPARAARWKCRAIAIWRCW